MRFAPIILLLFLTACRNDDTLFRALSPGRTGITFANTIAENDSINPIDVTNLYNGGGVGVGDFNKDGLPDLYFTGNLVPNKLYLNKGDLKFEDVTEAAGADGAGRWSRGVSVVDLNGDGWDDIYVCATMKADSNARRNLLYINEGAQQNGGVRFREMAARYGLDDPAHSTMAAFFDYDGDRDLDVYLVVNEILPNDYPSAFRPKITDGSHPSTGRLYRNNGNGPGGHPTFTNVTREAGVTIEGYGHGVNVTDINRDGRPDLFITNDFNSNDLLYINNGDGTFTDKASSYFRHTSANGMGQDIIDINGDGLSDVIELDMSPEDNYRKKMMMNANAYQVYQNSDRFGYQYQYVRNSLQLNRGPRPLEGDSLGDPVFSDIGYYSGIAETDWSWTPLVADFDGDGWRDLVVTNGFPKDITDHDFIAFRKESYAVASKAQTLAQIPQVKLHNYGYRNRGDLTFANATEEWGLQEPTFATGAAWADLDGDGDLDMVVNNINDPASVYENRLRQRDDAPAYLRIHLEGPRENPSALGAWVEVHAGGKRQVWEQTPYRGYLSSVQTDPHFGLGWATTVDSVVVTWPGGSRQAVRGVKVNETLTIRETSNVNREWIHDSRFTIDGPRLLSERTRAAGLTYSHQQRDFIDFNIQKLLPHKFSEYGPALAAGDLDGDGLDDLAVGGNGAFPARMLLQRSDGTFSESTLSTGDAEGAPWMDMGLLLFDAEGDGDNDLYFARGGSEAEAGSGDYSDRLLLNNGSGVFTPAPAGAVPPNTASKSCVRAADWDRDGDLDLFVAGRVEPGSYPKPVSSALYRNDSKGGVVRFTDVSAAAAPALRGAGLVCDAVFTDFDGDGWTDLLLAGEWMPLRFLKNVRGTFTDVSAATGLAGLKGWWNSLLPGDFDADGDIDYIAGNLGLNSFYRASEAEPVRIWAKDFDGNGSLDAVPSLYLPSVHGKGERDEYAAHTRDDMTKQLISFKGKYQNYKSYAQAPFREMFSKEELEGALVLEANYLSHAFLRNDGEGKFSARPLPAPAQFAPLNGMAASDLNGDGHLDAVLHMNDYGTEVNVGRYDAGNGLVLLGDGAGGFRPLEMWESGLYLPGNGRGLALLGGPGGQPLLAASENRGPLRLFGLPEGRWLRMRPDAVRLQLTWNNGKQSVVEVPWGASFLSQSARMFQVPAGVRSIKYVNNRGEAYDVKI